MKIYISSSWKMRNTVRTMAVLLRERGHEVYDFTDRSCRKTEEIPPEKFTDQFDPDIHDYATYLNNPHWKRAVEDNRAALNWCDGVMLILPCGNDAHADWALAVGMGKRSCIYGAPRKGDRSPVHHWADMICRNVNDVFVWASNQI